MLTIRYQPQLHPAVISALQQLRTELEAQGLPTMPPSALDARPEVAGPDEIWVGRAGWIGASAGNMQPLAEKARSLSADGYAWQVGQTDHGGRWAAVIGADDRGTLFGIYEFIERVQLARGWPDVGQSSSAPFFPIRRWSVAISRIQRRPWDDRRTLCDGLTRVQRIATLAPRYGINSLEINGRPGDGWDPDWVLAYRRYPQFAALRPIEESDDKMALVEETAQQARSHLLDLYVWSHELYVPPEFFTFFPEARGVDYDLCTSNPLVHEFIYNRYAELFEGVPSLTGVVISVTESGHFSLLTDTGCQCSSCQAMTRSDRLLAVLTPVIKACRDYGRTAVLRTFHSAAIHDLDSHPELEVIRGAFAHVPSHVQFMSKYCPQDFYGIEITDEPLIGAFDNPHLVEFSLDREWSGRTYAPALTPIDFQQRLWHARDKQVAGTVARVDFPFPEMEPEEIFTHANEFNAYVFGKLAWDPNYNIEQAWADWGQLRYGEAASAVVSALKRTELATERIFFVKGVPGVNYHNMIAPVDFSVENFWARVPSKWDPSKRGLTAKLHNPDEAFIHELAAGPLQAYDLMQAALADLAGARKVMLPTHYQKLRNQIQVLRDAGRLWSHLNDLFFRYVAWKDHRQLPEPGALAASLHAAQGVITQALAMERLHGRYSWPVFSPDRGISAYEFVEQLWVRYLSAFLGEPIDEYNSTRWPASFTNAWYRRQPGHSRDGYLGLWLDCFEMMRGAIGQCSAPRSIALPAIVNELRCVDNTLTLMSPSMSFALPVGLLIEGPSIHQGGQSLYGVRRTERGLAIEPAAG